MLIRFTHYEDSRDRFRAVMEHSSDGGATWTIGVRQTLVRVE